RVEQRDLGSRTLVDWQSLMRARRFVATQLANPQRLAIHPLSVVNHHRNPLGITNIGERRGLQYHEIGLLSRTDSRAASQKDSRLGSARRQCLPRRQPGL